MSNQKEPKIRFSGFTEEWKYRKLGNYLTIPEKIKTVVNSKEDLMTVKLNLGGIESGSKRETLELGSTVYYKRRAGQFIYGKQNFFNGSMAIIPNDLDGKATSGDVPSLNIQDIDIDYLYTYVSRKDYWKDKESAASGTGSKRIHEKTLQSFSIYVPSEKEQFKVGQFFEKIKEMIMLHQRELESFKIMKKSLLNKMFPKNGGNVPEIRFPEFTDPWEQRKLKEVSVYSNGGSYENDVLPYGKYELITLKSVDMSGNLVSSGKFLDLDVRTLEKGTLVMILSEQSPGLLGMTAQIPVDKKFVLNQRVAEIRPNKNIDGYFLSKAINISQAYFSKRGAGTKVQNISKPNVENFEFYCPTFEEQQKIGQFFKQLDDTIALHQRELDTLAEMKKILLKDMFI
ncbi:restriction endonuclease subunit S [Enterococcus sp. FDAARGOS_375]|uniref:restriction endonuclease subunit S n=1 Tax=Enterococcus sp. FDAARGOS_375 TaxID=2060307 RepID=UPI000BBD25F0|nr:restriction endonuclease subunit S [Enterococcus sp. FDAARGOS_375]ATF70595.1 restriction endonuclease subunit S [Enterococcus sp. FDAARGOS_375]